MYENHIITSLDVTITNSPTSLDFHIILYRPCHEHSPTRRILNKCVRSDCLNQFTSLYSQRLNTVEVGTSIPNKRRLILSSVWNWHPPCEMNRWYNSFSVSFQSVLFIGTRNNIHV